MWAEPQTSGVSASVVEEDVALGGRKSLRSTIRCAGVKLPNGRSSVQENTCQTRSGIQAEDESGSWNKSLWYLKLFERCLRGGGGTGDTEGT